MVVNVVTIDNGLVSFHSYNDVLAFSSENLPFPSLILNYIDESKEPDSIDMSSIVNIDIKLNDNLVEDWFHCSGAKGVAFYG